MKTQIRTLVTVSALVFTGVLNANSAVNFEEKNSGLINANESLTVLNEKNDSFESDLNGSFDYGKEALLVSEWIADMAEAKANQKVMELGFVAPSKTSSSFENEVANENFNETTDYGKEALLITKAIADKEEAKAIQRVMERGFIAPVETISSFEYEVENENFNETTDYGKEALLITKEIADKEEAKAIQRVMERGFIAPVGTISSFEYEVASENFNEATDYGKEALLITKAIADKEEVKAIQRVMERGFIAPVETISSFEYEVENENFNETTDYGKEALLINKLIADKAEADTLQQLYTEGKLLGNK